MHAKPGIWATRCTHNSHQIDAGAGYLCQQTLYTLSIRLLPGSVKELEVAADSVSYLYDAVHMHSNTNPAQDHTAYLGSTPEQRRVQQPAVSSIDGNTLVKEYTYSIASRAIQVTSHCTDTLSLCSTYRVAW